MSGFIDILKEFWWIGLAISAFIALVYAIILRLVDNSEFAECTFLYFDRNFAETKWFFRGLCLVISMTFGIIASIVAWGLAEIVQGNHQWVLLVQSFLVALFMIVMVHKLIRLDRYDFCHKWQT